MGSIQASPSAVAAYCAAGHTNAEAAAHFGVNERTIRKWKARAVSDRFISHQTAPTCATSMARMADVISDGDITVHIPDEWIARDGQLWKCGRCGELMPPLPGTTGASWNALGCYLHQVMPLGKTVEDSANTIGDDLPSDPAPESDPEAGPAPASGNDPAPAPMPASIWPGRPCRRRRLDPGWNQWISWGQRHMDVVQLTVGIVLVWVLVGVAF